MIAFTRDFFICSSLLLKKKEKIASKLNITECNGYHLKTSPSMKNRCSIYNAWTTHV